MINCSPQPTIHHLPTHCPRPTLPPIDRGCWKPPVLDLPGFDRPDVHNRPWPFEVGKCKCELRAELMQVRMEIRSIERQLYGPWCQDKIQPFASQPGCGGHNEIRPQIGPGGPGGLRPWGHNHHRCELQQRLQHLRCREQQLLRQLGEDKLPFLRPQPDVLA
jgi:hypothetical protein